MIDVNPLKSAVTVSLEKGGRKEFPREEVEPWAEVQALKKKAQSPCKIHGDKPCNCQKEKKAKSGD